MSLDLHDIKEKVTGFIALLSNKWVESLLLILPNMINFKSHIKSHIEQTSYRPIFITLA